MKFKINNREWKIAETSQESIKNINEVSKELDISEEEYLNSNEDIMIEKALEYINEQQKKKVY